MVLTQEALGQGSMLIIGSYRSGELASPVGPLTCHTVAASWPRLWAYRPARGSIDLPVGPLTCHTVAASWPRKGKRAVSLSVKGSPHSSLVGRRLCPDGLASPVGLSTCRPFWLRCALNVVPTSKAFFAHTHQLNRTFCGVATSDRKGRDGVNPSTIHLRVVQGERCSRGGLSPRGRRKPRLPSCR
jgi:hypothetical protein